MTTLVIIRHGNTFGPKDTPLRIGARTDMPLVESGKQQAVKVRQWLQQNNLVPDVMYCGKLQRTVQTAEIIYRFPACSDFPCKKTKGVIVRDERFNEMDYGPDEGKTEEEVIRRIGAEAMQNWDEQAVVPDGWPVDAGSLIKNWCVFGKFIERHYPHKTVAVVTSNGIARFALYLVSECEVFKQRSAIKIATGALCVLQHTHNHWDIKHWNLRPY